MKQDLKLYYTAPNTEIFEDLRRSAIKIWETYDNTYGYIDEKVDKVKSLGNIKDNFMYIFAMFDPQNQEKVMALIKKETQEAIKKRLPEEYLEINWRDNE